VRRRERQGSLRGRHSRGPRLPHGERPFRGHFPTPPWYTPQWCRFFRDGGRTVSNDLLAMFHHLDGLTGRPDVARLTEELSNFDVELADLTEYLHFSPTTYKRNLVRAGAHYHACLLCWKNGQRSPIHYHTR